MMTQAGAPDANSGIDWMLSDLVRNVPTIGHAVLLSTDGLLLGGSEELDQDQAERLSAVASAFHSLAKGAGRHFGGGPVLQTMVEMQEGFLLVCAAGDNACLTVLARQGPDIGVVAYEMAMLVKRLGYHMSAGARIDPPQDAGMAW
jgi:uncharacterized protein